MESLDNKFNDLRQKIENLTCNVHDNTEPIIEFCTKKNCQVGLICRYCKKLDHKEHDLLYHGSIMPSKDFFDDLFDKGLYYDYKGDLISNLRSEEYDKICKLEEMFQANLNKNLKDIDATIDNMQNDIISSITKSAELLKNRLKKEILDINGINLAIIHTEHITFDPIKILYMLRIL